MRQQATAWIIGHVGTVPESHGDGSAERTKFRVLNNTRYFDRNSQEWVEKQVNGTEITCWGDLARNVAASVQLGDPVVVHGRLEENRWVDKEGVGRKSVQLIAELIAHDLNRGTSRFVRSTRPAERPAPAVLDAELDPDGIADLRAEPVPVGAPF